MPTDDEDQTEISLWPETAAGENTMTDAERILAEARATLARPIPGGDRTHTGAADRFIAESDRRKREAEQQQHERERRLTDYEAAQLERRVEAKLAGMAAGERGFMLELLAEFLAHVQRQTDEKIGLLRADMNVQRAVDREGSNVIEMPDFLKREAS
jgi:hypothetical protein